MNKKIVAQPSIERTHRFIEQHMLIKPQDTVIVGLSGGPDSVFLLHALMHLRKQIPCTLIAAHLNHEWRSSAIDDELFCQQWCATLGIPIVVGHASQLAIQPKLRGSKEDVGRQLRRFFFAQVQKQYHAESIALAHHADDQLETFFVRLIRGATIAGLCGMRPKNGPYIRPLLSLHKQEIIDYLKAQTIPYVIDPTNTSPDFLRNRIRQRLVPLLQTIDQRAVANIERAIIQLQDVETFLVLLTNQAAHTCVTKTMLNLERFVVLDVVIQKRVLAHWLCDNGVCMTLSAALINEILRFFKNTKSTAHHFDGWLLRKDGIIVHIEKTSVPS